jgi:hypothetical protein
VVFIDRFVERPELLDHIAMCDVYVALSGGIADDIGHAGLFAWAWPPVVSAPWHAAELLEDGSGLLVPFAIPIVWAGRWPTC